MSERRIPDTITEEEVIKLAKACTNHKKKLALMLGFYQGMRISEVIKLQPEHIDKGRRLLMIKRSKGDKDRNIPIAPQTMNGLKYLPMNFGIRALQISFKRLAKKVLDKNLHFHCLRHSSATWYLNVQKWNLRQVQVFLGHSDISTTEVYTHVNDQDLQNAMWRV